MQIGIDSFAANLPNPLTGAPPSPADRMADLLDEIEVADRVGLDVFGIGDPDTVIAKMHHVSQALGSVARIMFQMSSGSLETDAMKRLIELLGKEVAPRMRAANTPSPHPPRGLPHGK